jgi:hypothetical protein
LGFGEVGAAHEADGDFVPECGERGEHLRGGGLYGNGEVSKALLRLAGRHGLDAHCELD